MTMKLAEALKIIQSAPIDAPPLPVGLLCGFSPLHLETFLRAELCRLFPDRKPEVQAGLYDDLIGNIDRITGVSTAVVVVEWPDLDSRLGLRRLGGWEPSHLPDVLSEVSRSCGRLQIAIATAAQKMPVIICFPTLPLVPISFTPAAQASEFTLELRSRVAALAAALAQAPGVRVIDPHRVDMLSSSGRLDVNSDLSAGFPYRLPHASALAHLFGELIRNRPPKKGLITDLDDTLWRGILGEVGVEGISWDLDHRSQIHALYQQLLHSLAASGVLIAVASKNEPSLVQAAFATRELVLRDSEIFPFEVHWGSKSESVRRILSAWNVAPEDVVCVDDSPMDLAEIQAAHPTIECLTFPTDNPQAAYELLERLRDRFGKDRLSVEDALRSASLRGNAELKENLNRHASTQHASHSSSRDAAAFVRQIDGRLTLSCQKHPFDPRAFELINKTNQFNLNGRRVQEFEWQKWLDAPGTFMVTASYRDKYGPLGEIAVIVGDLSSIDTAANRLRIRTWVMSCRAFSRFIEYDCLRWLFAKLDLDDMEFDFLPTLRNAPMQTFLQRVRNAPPEPNCLLSRDQFMLIYPESTHVIVEAATNDMAGKALPNV